jgi:Zn-dependent protease with chaperone function
VLVAAVALALLAVALAWPVPVLLARAAWTRQAPATALLLWQAIALAGALSIMGALLTFGLAPFGDSLLGGVAGFVGVYSGDRAIGALDLGNLFALTAAALFGGHLLLNLLLTAVRSERQRQRHRHLVRMLSSPLADSALVDSPLADSALADRRGLRLIDTPAPVAYCLPGATRSVTVLSAGLMRLLGGDELRAVIEHERAHVDQRHYLVLLAFRAWHASLPWFPVTSLADREVGELVEMLADDRARRTVDDRTLATAIALVAGMPRRDATDAVPADGDDVFAAESSQITAAARVRRLLGARRGVPRTSRLAVAAGAGALIAVPTVLLLAPSVGLG